MPLPFKLQILAVLAWGVTRAINLINFTRHLPHDPQPCVTIPPVLQC